MRALIAEHGVNRGALAACRSLARAGWTVGIASSTADGLARTSRVVAHSHAVPPAGTEPEGFAVAVAALVAEYGYEIVFPVDDAQVLALSAHRHRIAAIVPYPPHEVVVRTLDRLEQARAAARAGLAVPETRPVTPEVLDELTGLVAIKARTYAAVATGGRSPHRVETRVGEAAEARAWVREIAEAGAEAIVQPAVRGQLMSITTLLDREGRVVAQEQQRSLRIWPLDAGVSVRARTEPLDPHLARGVAEMLRDLGWHGMAQTQFLQPAGGSPQLIDVNPRFYGSLGLAVAAGADFPALWARMAMGQPVEPATARPGRRYQWLGGDLRRAVAAREGGLLRDLRGTARWAPGAAFGVWSWSDPGPALRAAAGFARHRLGLGA